MTLSVGKFEIYVMVTKYKKEPIVKLSLLVLGLSTMIAFGQTTQDQSLKLECSVNSDLETTYTFSRSKKGYSQYAVISDETKSVKIENTSVKTHSEGHEAFVIMQENLIEDQAQKLADLYEKQGNGSYDDKDNF